MTRLLSTLALAALLAPGALALGAPDPAAHDLARVLEVELRWLGAQPRFHQHRHSVAELAAVREALRRALLYALPDREVIHRVLVGTDLDLDETPAEFGRRLAARARALGPHGVERWGAVTEVAARAFSGTRFPASVTMASLLRGGAAAPDLPPGFDFTWAPEEPIEILPAWARSPRRSSAGLDGVPSAPSTGDPEMDLLAAQVLASLRRDVSSQASTSQGGAVR